MISNPKFKRLLEPGYIGPVKIRNRMIKTAAETLLSSENDGYVTEALKAFYGKIAKGGVGAVYVEGPVIAGTRSRFGKHGFHIDGDKYIPGLNELVKAIHEHGCPAFIQLLHSGPWHRSWLSGIQPIAASSSEEGVHTGFEPSKEATVAEIEDIIDKFAGAAVRAREAGFDGVDINSALSHFLSTFLSRHWNKREDAYGYATLDSRARIVVEIIHEIKKRVGQDYPVGVIYNGTEYGGSGKGITIEEAQEFAQMFERAGAASLHIRSHRFGTLAGVWPEQLLYPEPPKVLEKELDWSHGGAAMYSPLAAAIKKVVSIPVITVGRLDPMLGERILREGKADFIGFTRRLLADPELPNKVASGRMEDIAPCTACLSCVDTNFLGQPIRCRINASLGREKEYEIKPAKEKKKVLVVGGGPSGMEAARVASLRGHEVLLYEKEKKLGGLLPTAAVVKGLEIEDLEAIIRYFKIQLLKQGVQVRLGEQAELSSIEEARPDVVVLAAGGVQTVPHIPGIENDNVVRGPELHRKAKFYQRFFVPKTLGRLTKLWMPIGKNIVIIGGAIQGSEMAEFLVKRRRKVTITDFASELGDGIGPGKKEWLFEWLEEKGVKMYTEVKYEEITDKGLEITTKKGERQTLEADTVLTASPMKPSSELVKKMEKSAPEIYSIGDCDEPGLIIDAVAAGASVGHAI
ncbi:MAG: FAD-dependent oxidoreductase [Deltaproteobacteria bacterium]|nr:FAD-dependent oxidoreductase [Deltaproteobacteria bacterium]